MPPPPPPAPPPIPKQASGAKSKNAEPPADRNALLSQIRKGARLKKAETNDRSGPLIEGSKSSNTPSASNGTLKLSSGGKSNSSPFPIIPPGGLFAQGIPKLRPTVPRTDGFQSNLKIQSIRSGNTGSSSSLDHLRVGQLSGSRSQPPSPVSKPRMSSGPSSLRSDNGGNPNFPDDVNIKGPAPAPPPASQKPAFNKPNIEQIPSKPTVKRSASQTNLGQRPRLTRPPPNVKPPPPPKTGTPTPPQTAPPPPPSKPPNILRRQSFGVGEGPNSRLAANKLSVANDVPKSGPKSIGAPPPPPPPPRNNSAPNDLNKMVVNNNGSFPSNHVMKMNIAPPPPPPNRAMVSGNRVGTIRPPPPRAPAPPPPPPSHHFNSLPAPPSQLKASLSASQAPPPPARVSSMKQSNFEDRFRFQVAQVLPKPERCSNTQKTYPSKANRQKQSTRRLPPPPPPQSGNILDSNRGQTMVHIQLNSGIFSNNVAHG